MLKVKFDMMRSLDLFDLDVPFICHPRSLSSVVARPDATYVVDVRGMNQALGSQE